MRKTEMLGLPIYDSPETDLFKFQDWNEGNQKIDNKIKEIGSSLEQKSKFQKIARNTDGYGDNGAVIGVIANKGDNPTIQVSNYTTPSQASQYENRDSVALYISNTSTNHISIDNVTYTLNTVTTTNNVDIDKVKKGMVIDTKHTPNHYVGIIEKIEGNVITIKEGWYLVKEGGSTIPSVPTNDYGIRINMVTKIWGINNNVFLNTEDFTPNAMAEEIGLFGNKAGGSIGGIDIVNFGNLRPKFGHMLRVVLNAGKFMLGYAVTKATHAFATQGGDLEDFLLSSLDDEGVYNKNSFYIKNNGLQNKLKLDIKTISSVTDTFNISTSIAIFNLISGSNYTLPLASENAGRVFYLRNAGATFNLINSVGLIYNPLTGSSNSYPVLSGDVVTLISDGTNYILQTVIGACVPRNGGTIGGTLNVNGTIASTGNISVTGDSSYLKTSQSSWDKGHLQLGGYHIWIDSTGRLRIKNGNPTSDIDGAVIGTQN